MGDGAILSARGTCAMQAIAIIVAEIPSFESVLSLTFAASQKRDFRSGIQRLPPFTS